MDEPGNHHSQEIDTGTENQAQHILTHRWVLNNENTWTQGGEHHTLRSLEGGLGEGQWRGGITWGEMPDIGDGDGDSKLHCHLSTYATTLHVLYMYPRT